MSAGHWVNVFEIDEADWVTAGKAKRAKTRLQRNSWDAEEVLVSTTDTSHAARRRVSIYANLEA